jgi:hypothetical protein
MVSRYVSGFLERDINLHDRLSYPDQQVWRLNFIQIPGFGYAGVMFQPQLVFDISISGGVELTWGFKVNVRLLLSNFNSTPLIFPRFPTNPPSVSMLVPSITASSPASTKQLSNPSPSMPTSPISTLVCVLAYALSSPSGCLFSVTN